ncbi:TauD/TfdA family dioxygenase [Micromonospora sp. CA-240977]|uniref:TauD/TfdA family dioxygenase n=1 Tax=Micromonospora sp. CA-240977 TaxID=3239957 RepID=UPI003D928F7C
MLVETDSMASATDGGAFLADGDERLMIAEVAGRLMASGSRQIDDPEWVALARGAWEELPGRLRGSIRRFRRDSGPYGSLLVRGLPVGEEDLPPTPTVAGSVQRSATIPASVLAMVACGLGDPTAFRAEKTGALVQDVVPVPGMETFQGNAGSVRLSFHSENAFHEHRPDFVMLLCLRADPDRVAGLRLACVRACLPRLSEAAREALFSKSFVTAAPPSFGSGGANTTHAVLRGPANDPDMCVDLAATSATTAAGREALLELQRVFEATARTIRLVPGDLAIVDNRVTVHGRDAFTPRYDGRDRWLQRTFVSADLRRSRDFRPDDSYVLDR